MKLGHVHRNTHSPRLSKNTSTHRLYNDTIDIIIYHNIRSQPVLFLPVRSKVCFEHAFERELENQNDQHKVSLNFA